MSQANELYNLLKDGLPHRTDEVMEKVYGGSHLGLARAGARIFDLKKRGHIINGWKDKNRQSLYWYQLEIPKPAGQQMLFIPQQQKVVVHNDPA